MALLQEYSRVLKRMNLIIFCSKEQLRGYLNWIYDKEYLWILITWNKTNPIPATNNTYVPDTEYIFHIWEKGTGLNGCYDTKRRFYLTEVNKNNFNHPTVKPLEIIRNLIINATNEGDIVLDPFLGSGTTALASKQLKRKYIGFEIKKEYFEIAEHRLCQTTLQGVLTDGN